MADRRRFNYQPVHVEDFEVDDRGNSSSDHHSSLLHSSFSSPSFHRDPQIGVPVIGLHPPTFHRPPVHPGVARREMVLPDGVSRGDGLTSLRNDDNMAALRSPTSRGSKEEQMMQNGPSEYLTSSSSTGYRAGPASPRSLYRGESLPRSTYLPVSDNEDNFVQASTLPRTTAAIAHHRVGSNNNYSPFTYRYNVKSQNLYSPCAKRSREPEHCRGSGEKDKAVWSTRSRSKVKQQNHQRSVRHHRERDDRGYYSDDGSIRTRCSERTARSASGDRRPRTADQRRVASLQRDARGTKSYRRDRSSDKLKISSTNRCKPKRHRDSSRSPPLDSLVPWRSNSRYVTSSPFREYDDLPTMLPPTRRSLEWPDSPRHSNSRTNRALEWHRESGNVACPSRHIPSPTWSDRYGLDTVPYPSRYDPRSPLPEWQQYVRSSPPGADSRSDRGGFSAFWTRLELPTMRFPSWRDVSSCVSHGWTWLEENPNVQRVSETLGRQKVIALVCGIVTAFLMVLALASSDWLLAIGWRQGLFEHCVEPGAPKPLPFKVDVEPGCHRARDELYIMASAALCIVCLLLDCFATLMTGLGLNSNNANQKTKYYRIAVWVMTLALVAILVALILYPVFFSQELELGNRTLWEFGWAYGVGWGAAIFLFGAVVLLLCDQEEEEVYYKERTVMHTENDSRA